MATYVLKTALKQRIAGDDDYIAELEIPDVITVGMARKARLNDTNEVAVALRMTVVCSGLKGLAAEKLEAADAMAYFTHIAPMMAAPEYADEPETFTIPPLKPVRAVIAQINASITAPVEYTAQMLEYGGGMSRDEIDAIPLSDFMIAVNIVMSDIVVGKAS